MAICNVHAFPFLQAFADAAKQTADSFQKDEAPFFVKNHLGLPVSVRHSEMFCLVGQQSTNLTVNLQDGETLGMDYSTTTDSDQFSAMTSLSGKDYYIQPSKLTCTHNYTVCTCKSRLKKSVYARNVTCGGSIIKIMGA